jgi:type II secretory pathway pseudopilin PulG
MRDGPRRPAGDRGETLLELLVAVAIMGTAVIAVVGGLGVSVLISDVHRKQATAGWAARDYAAAISRVHYVDCADATYYRTNAGYTPPAGYAATIVSVANWTDPGWSTTSCLNKGLAQVTVQVASQDGRASERLTFVLRG